MTSLRETYGLTGSIGIYPSLSGRHHTNLGGPGTATQGDGSTDGSASEPDGPMGSGGTGGFGNTSGGTVLAMTDNDEMMDLEKQRKKKDMQFEAWVDRLVKEQSWADEPPEEVEKVANYILRTVQSELGEIKMKLKTKRDIIEGVRRAWQIGFDAGPGEEFWET